MNISIIIQQLIILFCIMLLGYILYKVKIMTDEFNKQLTKLLLNVTTPALVLNSVLDDQATLPMKTFVTTFVVATLVYLLLPVLSKGVTFLLRAPKSQRGIYDFASTYGNVGFMGYPLIAAILGPNGLLLTAVFNILFNLSVYSIGVLVISKGTDKKQDISLKTFLSPGILMSVVSIFVYIFHIHLPQTLCSVISSVGSVTSPLAMLLIGATLASMPALEMLNEKRTYVFLLIRQLLVPMALYPLLKLCIQDTLLLTVTFIMISMPVGNTSVLFATNYDLDKGLAAKCVFITTLFSVVTIPLLCFLCLGN